MKYHMFLLLASHFRSHQTLTVDSALPQGEVGSIFNLLMQCRVQVSTW